jgi:hypothetical protein
MGRQAQRQAVPMQGAAGEVRARRRAAGGGSAARLAPLRTLEIGSVWPWLRRCLEHEVEHAGLFPWIAVGFGLGVLLFFRRKAGRRCGRRRRGGHLSCRRHRAAPRPDALRRRNRNDGGLRGFAAGVVRQRAVDAPASSG